MKNIYLVMLLIVLVQFTNAHANTLNSDVPLSLQNLERERVVLIDIMLNPALSHEQRLNTLNSKQRLLTDLERMVIRDERLLNSHSIDVRKAFEQYDTTFLVHAGAEKNKSASVQWLTLVGLDNQALLSTKKGFR